MNFLMSRFSGFFTPINSNLGNIRYASTSGFGDAWQAAESGYMYFIDVYGTDDAPITDTNHWFVQQWKNDNGLYGWQITWSFTAGIYKRQRANSNAWSNWTYIS